MKKTILFVALLMLPVAAHAAPAYGTKMPEQKQLFAGLQSYSILNHDLEGNYGRVRSQQEFLLLSYGIFDWLSLDLKGGFGDIHQHGGVEPDLDYSTFLAGGYGFRIKLYDHDKAKVVTGFQHISVHPREESDGIYKHKTVLDDWQFSLLGSYDMFGVTPYVGTKLGWTNKIHWIDHERNLEKGESAPTVGLITGVDIPLNQRTWINVEGQFVDAEAVAASINFSF